MSENKIYTSGKILKMDTLAQQVVSMWVQVPHMSQAARPGQFVSIYSDDKAHLLPRPISICEIDKENGALRFVFRVVGEGTAEFSKKQAGEYLDMLGPLGNGYELREDPAIVIGGGIGVPPMLELFRSLKGEKVAVLGYRDANTFLLEEFKKEGPVYISTEDGSLGTKGNVIDCITENGLKGQQLYACGPKPMLLGVRSYAKENDLKAQISLEERMACGIGACLACVFETTKVDAHSNVKNKRICKDGPVFDLDEL